MTYTTRRRLLQSSSALALAALLPRCAATTKRPLEPVAFADIPRSEFGFDTIADEVVAGLDLSGKTALVTGSNSGLGLESARVLAGAGADVIGTTRTAEKADQVSALARDEQWVGQGRGSFTAVTCELTDMNSVAECATQVNAMLDGGSLAGRDLDILMCNAGIMALPELEQVDVNGVLLEKQFVVNHLGHYLLTRKLLPSMLSATAPRIVMVSSGGYGLAPKGGILFDNLSYAQGYQPFKAYGQSKLANILMSKELTTRYFGQGITANAIGPGVVATNLGRYIRGSLRDPNEPLGKGQKWPDQGAATQVYVAADPRLAGVSGFYFEDCNPLALRGAYASDPDLARRLWEVSAELVQPWV